MRRGRPRDGRPARSPSGRHPAVELPSAVWESLRAAYWSRCRAGGGEGGGGAGGGETDLGGGARCERAVPRRVGDGDGGSAGGQCAVPELADRDAIGQRQREFPTVDRRGSGGNG